MSEELSFRERKILQDFIEQESPKVPVVSEKTTPVITGIIMFAGAAVFGASAVSITQDITGDGLTMFAIPGLVVGIGVILFGSILQKYLKMQFQRQKVVQILKKIMK
ncbi:MAG TPA: hypothetical protein VJ946_10895 [Bacteroidales bacterium]|nr:hypothetical protein [Bacteroidales bacterium]